MRTDSLGHYLAALGLLRVASRRWTRVRGAWRDGWFCIVGGPDDLAELQQHVLDVGRARRWTPYTRAWKEAREAARGDDSLPLALWQSEVPEGEAEFSLAHSVAADELYDNPLLGQGGAASRRDFAKGWAEAAEKIQDAKGKTRDQVDADLAHFLEGEACTVLRDWNWNAASWFSQANKLYNFSSTKPFVKGQITPWAMVLACEGLPFFAGSASRRLGARARREAAFPFVTEASASQAKDLLGHDRGEAWLPVWSRPMTVAEVRMLFLRGRAEVTGRGAVTPAAFASAIVGRGVDAGVDGFARFALAQTTNPDMFESACVARVPVPGPSSGPGNGRAETVERIVELVEHLPRDDPGSARRPGEFLGLRGPVEGALTVYARQPDDPESAHRMLDAVVEALDRVDRNRKHRTRGVTWRPLPLAWLPTLFGNDRPPLEARLAMAFASVGAPDDPVGPLLFHRFGVERQAHGTIVFPKTAPARRVWARTYIADDLTRAVRRRLVDVEGPNDREPPTSGRGSPAVALPFLASISLDIGDIGAWLDGEADPVLAARWLSRLVLFDWRSPPKETRSLVKQETRTSAGSGLVHLYGLIRPLLDPRALPTRDGDLLPTERSARTVGAARRVVALLQTGQVDEAIAVALSRYRIADRPPARFTTRWGPLDAARRTRLLAGLLLQAQPKSLASLATKWLAPHAHEGDHS